MTVHVAYLAGIIDGEGSIMLVRTGNAQIDGLYTSWTIKLQIANTNLELLKALQAEFGGIIKRTTGKVVEENSNWKVGYRLEWYGKRASDICLLVLDYLIIKREQAVISMKAMAERDREGGKGVRKTIGLVRFLNASSVRVKELNKRGASL